MMKDLQNCGTLRKDCEILIIGGGTAGLFTSVWLAEAGHDVICVESGGLHQDSEEHHLNEVVHLKSVYKGASHGRYRCIGGTSTRWGGALIPFQSGDLLKDNWPISRDDLDPYLSQIEREFGLNEGSYDLPELSTATHTARLAKWPPFKKRNVFNLLRTRIESLGNLEVFLNATVTEFVVTEALARSITARSESGDRLVVNFKKIIIAAGAIETTRLVQILDAQNGNLISNMSKSLGQYFSDHLSIEVGEMITSKPSELNRHVGFRFEANGTMRNLRFELGADPHLRSAVAPGFAHIGFETDGQGGFDVLRNVFRALQKRRPPSLMDTIGLARTSPWLIRAAWSRYLKNRLLFPDKAKFAVHMVIEQEPVAGNFLSLSADKKDVFGNPLAEIAWSVTDRDRANLTKAVDAFEAMWKNMPLSAATRFVRSGAGKAEADLVKGGGIYHPTGTTRMAANAYDGVVDRDLRVFAVKNLQLLSTSVLPSGGGANPTMMLMLLAARCVHGKS